MAYLIARNHINGGYIDVRPEDIPEELKNKRIIIEDLDSDGNVMSTNTLVEEDKDLILSVMVAINDNLYLAKKEDVEIFNDDEIEVIKELMWRDNFFLTKESIEKLKVFLNIHKLEKIKFALHLSRKDIYGGYQFCTSPNNPFYLKEFDFIEAFEFIEEREGIYYAVTNEGEKHWDFIEEPTKKQAQYQRRKNDNRIVFFSFEDWKEYLVSENELL